ncbi:MAG: hypothetical protein JO208_01865 [Alphaproteobacteria bacterium]|nr:hypothetical protein [Alphaproteobacteria bacterium]
MPPLIPLELIDPPDDPIEPPEPLIDPEPPIEPLVVPPMPPPFEPGEVPGGFTAGAVVWFESMVEVVGPEPLLPGCMG